MRDEVKLRVVPAAVIAELRQNIKAQTQNLRYLCAKRMLFKKNQTLEPHESSPWGPIVSRPRSELPVRGKPLFNLQS